MKKLNNFLYRLLLTFILLDISKIAIGNTTNYAETPADSIRVSLLTCSPHDEIYSLYGHTAIRYEDKASKTDIVVNYGMFSFKKPYFVARFVLGLTDYEMGIQDFADFCYEYQYYGSQVTQQEINLTPEEKGQLLKALQDNYANARVYRYNYFYNNCTTKARDILLGSIDGKVVFNRKIDENVSFRDMIHQCTKNHPWAQFGNDLLLGVKADANTTRDEQQFMPANLMKDFSHAVIERGQSTVPLVTATRQIIEPNTASNETKGSIFSPLTCAMLLCILTICMMMAEIFTGKVFWGYDALLLSLLGLAGLVLLAMVFSQHPTVSLNLQILILNPLFLYAAYYVVRNRKDKRKTRNLWTIIGCIVFISWILGFFQDYASGIILLALSLLMRCRSVIERTDYNPIRSDKTKKGNNNNEK